MKPLLLAAGVSLMATAAVALNLRDLQNQVTQLQSVNEQRQTAPPAEQTKLEAQRQQLVTQIRGAAEAEPKEYMAQYAVARGLLAAGEEGHATVYADRATTVAHATGDKQKEIAALTLAALAYQKAGDMEAANDRAKKALWIEPKNKTALQVVLATKGRISTGGAAAARTDAPLPPVAGAATSGSGRSDFPPPDRGPQKPAVVFVGGDTQKAIKLVGEAQRTWSLDRKAALRLFDEAVAADPNNTHALAGRARARLETGDFKGALEDAGASLVGGPHGEGHHVRAKALQALGGKQEDILAAFKAAAEIDERYAPDYQTAIAALGRQDTAPASVSSGPSADPAMAEDASAKRYGLFALIALVLAALAFALFGRRSRG